MGSNLFNFQPARMKKFFKFILKPPFLILFFAFFSSIFFFSKLAAPGNEAATFIEKKTVVDNFSEEGIFIKKASVEEGIVGNYQKEDKAVYFQIKRGEKNPWIKRLLTDGPKYSVEIVFADNRGLVFLSQGGSQSLPIFDLLEDRKGADQSSEDSFLLAYEAVDVLRRIDFGTELFHEKKALVESNFRQ